MSTFKFSFNKKNRLLHSSVFRAAFSTNILNQIDFSSLSEIATEMCSPPRRFSRKQLFLNFKLSNLIIGLAKSLPNTCKEIYWEVVHFHLEACNLTPRQVFFKGFAYFFTNIYFKEQIFVVAFTLLKVQSCKLKSHW